MKEHGHHAKRGMNGVLVDRNVLLDVLAEDSHWHAWSVEKARGALPRR